MDIVYHYNVIVSLSRVAHDEERSNTGSPLSLRSLVIIATLSVPFASTELNGNNKADNTTGDLECVSDETAK